MSNQSTARRLAALIEPDLRAAGVETLIHYPIACHLQPAFAHLGFREGQFPLAERLAQEVLSLPMWPTMPAADARSVLAALQAAG